jgi:hypothetical protein
VLSVTIDRTIEQHRRLAKQVLQTDVMQTGLTAPAGAVKPDARIQLLRETSDNSA